MPPAEAVLILSPMKDAACNLPAYFSLLRRLTYPRYLLSVGVLESDSVDETYEAVHAALPDLGFASATAWKRDYHFHLPRGVPRHHYSFQVQRRSILAKSRNQLLFRALKDQAWVLWLDSDVCEYPPDIIERLLATGKQIVQPHCVYDYGGSTFDRNGWRNHGSLHLDQLRHEGDLVPLDSVGGTMLLVQADLHRDGLVFPAFPYGLANPRIRMHNHWLGEIETEGLGMMAGDMGVQCWGMPNLEIRHRRA